MNYKTLTFTLLFFLFFPISSVFARETIAPDIGSEDLYFYNDVFIEDVEMPEDQEANEGTSVVLLEGTGSLTLINKKIDNQGNLRFTLFGGTQIESQRIWHGDYLKNWWGGVLPSLSIVPMPRLQDIDFTNFSSSDNTRKLVYSAYGLGMENEIFHFSQPAMFVFPVAKPNGTKIWMASRGLEESRWSVSEQDFCIVEDGLCIYGLTSLNEVALIEQMYSRCETEPGDVPNGRFIGPPTCSLQCYDGYMLNESLTECIAIEGMDMAGRNTNYEIRPGTFRFLESRTQLDREFDLDVALTGEKKHDDRIRIHNAASHETVRDDVGEITNRQNILAVENGEFDTKSGDNGFMNYLLEIRNAFKPSPNVFSEEVTLSESKEMVDDEGNPLANEDGFYASAPLLPSTGAGIFLTLIILGIALMIFARRRQI